MGGIESESEKILKAEDLVSRLESEVKKIDAFKRELPLCMLLMNDGLFLLFVCLFQFFFYEFD
ncbi:hypothetical protein HanRHA438_Chr09g0421651 [Helianthus annuus]|nr:hypothetical protein HanRHA438_Chr09g0421651 [Helianthus annuus]